MDHFKMFGLMLHRLRRIIGHIPSMTALARIQHRLGFVESAESWLNLAARWNDQEAISSLSRLYPDRPAALGRLQVRPLGQQRDPAAPARHRRRNLAGPGSLKARAKKNGPREAHGPEFREVTPWGRCGTNADGRPPMCRTLVADIPRRHEDRRSSLGHQSQTVNVGMTVRNCQN